MTSDPVLQALTEAVVEATGAAMGWLLERRPEGLRIVAVAGAGGVVTAGGPDGSEVVGAVVPETGTAGFVASSGQPMAIRPRHQGDDLVSAVAALVGREPASILCVPCDTGQAVNGVIEVIDKGGDRFSFDDVELATLLAGVAAVALQRATESPAAVTPAELAGRLERLAATDPAGYVAVAGGLAVLLGHA